VTLTGLSTDVGTWVDETKTAHEDPRREGPARAGHIEARNVTKSFVSPRGDTLALEDVSLDAEPGIFLSIVGASGCGKSTLLQILAGLVPATDGAVRVGGKPISGPDPDIIYVFQQYTRSLFPWKTVRGNVRFGLEARERLPADEIDERVDEFLRLVKLEGFEKHYPWELSGGMQQRVAIARALVCRPRVLLMDEPFGAVDALTRAELQDLLLDVWRQFGLTIVFVTHDIEEAIYLSDRVVVLGPPPQGILADCTSDLPRPRHQIDTREAAAFLSLRHTLLDLLFRKEK
jgi:NitT/TauT family transport system ATP-binding protein